MKRSYMTLLVFLVFGCTNVNEPGVLSSIALPRVDLTVDYENLQILNANVFSDRYVDAKFQYEGYQTWVNIRYQGQSTRNLVKKNYRIRFPEDQLFEQRRYSILLAQFRDPSLLRSYLAYDLFRQAGLMTPQVKYVSLFLNREFNGIFLMLEPIDEYFLRNRGKREGNLYQALGGVAHFTLRDGTDIHLKFKKKLGEEADYSDLEYLMAVLDNTPTAELPRILERIFDVETYLEYMAVSALIANWDGFISNLNLYLDPDQQRFVVIPWDMDLTFKPETVNWNIAVANELNQRLFDVDGYRNAYKAKVQDHLDDLYSEQRMFALIDQWVMFLRDAYVLDPFLQGYSLEQEAEELKQFIRLRRAYLATELGGMG